MANQTREIIRVEFLQHDVKATFNLTPTEAEALRKYSTNRNCFRKGELTEYSAFTWTKYNLSTFKHKRFYSIFKLDGSDLHWHIIDENR